MDLEFQNINIQLILHFLILDNEKLFQSINLISKLVSNVKQVNHSKILNVPKLSSFMSLHYILHPEPLNLIYKLHYLVSFIFLNDVLLKIST